MRGQRNEWKFWAHKLGANEEEAKKYTAVIELFPDNSNEVRLRSHEI